MTITYRNTGVLRISVSGTPYSTRHTDKQTDWFISAL